MEILVIMIVALIVFGPSKLPMLAMHLGLLVNKFIQLKQKTQDYWKQQWDNLQLTENEKKAAQADRYYTHKD